MTNFEKIKQMSIEELAEFLLHQTKESDWETHSGEWFYSREKDLAIDEEKRWLESEADNE